MTPKVITTHYKPHDPRLLGNGLSPELERAAQEAPDLPFDFTAWRVDKAFAGDPPPLEWLVEHVVPARGVGMLAAQGETGKTYLLQDLAVKVAAGPDGACWLGHRVARRGAAVVLGAEDGRGTVHRRLAALIPAGAVADVPLYIVPLPDAGGHGWSLVTGAPGRFDAAGADALLARLKQIPNLALVVLDPLQALVQVDINAAPEAAQFVCTTLARISSECSCAVIVAHHNRKGSSAPETVAEAREAIRGTSALVDGVRFAIALWNADPRTTRAAAKRLGLSDPTGAIVRAAVVKSNEPADRSVRTLVRSPIGLLEDRTAELAPVTAEEIDGAALERLVDAIAAAAADGRPFCKRSPSAGVHARREELPEPFKHLGRNRLEAVVQRLLEEGRVVGCTAKGSRLTRWLDVPDGPFARGVGEFRTGAAPSNLEPDLEP